MISVILFAVLVYASAEASASTRLVLPEALQWIVLAGGVIYALSLLWRRAMKPLFVAVNLLVEVRPILEELANQFKPNGGKSLYDTIHRLDQRTQRIEDRLDIADGERDEIEAEVFPNATDPEVLDVIADHVMEKMQGE